MPVATVCSRNDRFAPGYNRKMIAAAEEELREEQSRIREIETELRARAESEIKRRLAVLFNHFQ